jgi:hypothetical protein
VAKVSIDLGVAPPVQSDQPFAVTVVVASGPPGQTTVVTLRQTQGTPPWFQQMAKVELDPSGGGSKMFRVQLHAEKATSSDAVLLAGGSDSLQTHYASDAKYVEVHG